MVTFKEAIIKKTVDKLIKGKDYRQEIINFINTSFLDFAIDFFKEIVEAKCELEDIDLDWYKKHFINSDKYETDAVAIFAGINKKTIKNIYGSTKKEIVLDISRGNLDYLYTLITSLEEKLDNGMSLKIKLSYNNINVDLSLSESLIVINALATKKIAIRGGAWSSIGKRVEKPLVNRLCKIAGVPKKNMDGSIFIKNHSLPFDREIDFKLISNKKIEYKIEVKLMGRGNPESADVMIARDTNIFIADTLSQQNKNQLKSLKVEYLELKNNKNIIDDFKKILKKLDIPFNK
jgi:hypothetical protein